MTTSRVIASVVFFEVLLGCPKLASACHSEIFVDISDASLAGFELSSSAQTMEVAGKAEYGYLYTLRLPGALDVDGGYFSSDLSERSTISEDFPDYDPARYFYSEDDLGSVCILLASVGKSKCATNYYFGVLTEMGEQPPTCMGALGASGRRKKDDA